MASTYRINSSKISHEQIQAVLRESEKIECRAVEGISSGRRAIQSAKEFRNESGIRGARTVAEGMFMGWSIGQMAISTFERARNLWGWAVGDTNTSWIANQSTEGGFVRDVRSITDDVNGYQSLEEANNVTYTNALSYGKSVLVGWRCKVCGYHNILRSWQCRGCGARP